MVLLLKISGGIVGSLGTLASYMQKSPISTNPMIRGAKTCAEPQGYLMPPQVNPMIAKPVPMITIALPLVRRFLSCRNALQQLTRTYSQSTRANLLFIEPFGACTCKKTRTRVNAIPVRGRLSPRRVSLSLKMVHVYLQNNQRQVFRSFPARAPPCYSSISQRLS